MHKCLSCGTWMVTNAQGGNETRCKSCSEDEEGLTIGGMDRISGFGILAFSMGVFGNWHVWDIKIIDSQRSWFMITDDNEKDYREIVYESDFKHEINMWLARKGYPKGIEFK